MNASSGDRSLVELLAEELLDHLRHGEHSTLREFVERHPELSGEIREVLPALLMMEGFGATSGPLAADNPATPTSPDRGLDAYRRLREIGRGGRGVMYEAEHRLSGRRVALKVLRDWPERDSKQVRQFEREMEAAAKLHHANIVPYLAMGQQTSQHYVVMPFIAGLSLDVALDNLRRLRRAESGLGPAAASAPATTRITGLMGVDVDDATLAAANAPHDGVGSSSAILPGSSQQSTSSDPGRQFFRSVARIGVQVADALEHANRHGILHRDIKPSNLLLDSHGTVWVTEFGLANSGETDDLMHAGDIVGTIRYMAPERFWGQCDARSDVYSLGLTLYELVALQPAFEASDRSALIQRIMHDSPERLKKLAPGVPRDLETIVTKAIERDPTRRYASAEALAEDLRRFVKGQPIRARRVSPAERLARWCRRNMALAAFGLVFAPLVIPWLLVRRGLPKIVAALRIWANSLWSRISGFFRGLRAWQRRDRRRNRDGLDMNHGENSASNGVVQTFQGFVDAVHHGMAYLTLETADGHRLELEWDAAELAAKSIGERQPFTLETVTTSDTMRFKFTLDRLQPLSSQLLQEIDELAAHYRARVS